MNPPARPAFLRRHWMLGVGLGAAAAGAGLGWWRWQPGPALPQQVQSFWAQRFEQPSGEVLDMARWRGRPLLVNFWATWCPPCVEELPMIEAFWRQHAAKGLQVVGLAIDQASSVRRFLERQSLTFPVALGGIEGANLGRALGNTQGGLPFSVFFKADGSIYQQKIGKLAPSDLDAWHAAWARGQA